MKELLRKLYQYIEPKLFDETFAQVDAERIELKLKVEELEDRVYELEEEWNAPLVYDDFEY